MSDPALRYPEVRAYLAELDVAVAMLAAPAARELREQITEHLADALADDADDRQVAEVIARLGPPAGLVAETMDDLGSGRRRSGRLGKMTVRQRLTRLGWRKVTAVVIPVILLSAAAGYAIAVATAPALQFNGSFGWWFRQDGMHEVTTSADGHQQVTVPVRSDQRQGFVIQVLNPSDWTQTVLGVAPDWAGSSWADPQVGVSPEVPNWRNAGFPAPTYIAGGSIPPHQYLDIRVLWTSQTCLVRGGSEGLDTVLLRVRTGWFVRTEAIQLPVGVFLAGPSQGRWRAPGPNC